jgi:hypothetical protein
MSSQPIINFALSKEDFQDLMQMAERAISLRTSQTNVWCKLRGNLGTQYLEQTKEASTGSFSVPIETENIKQLPSMQPNESSKL